MSQGTVHDLIVHRMMSYVGADRQLIKNGWKSNESGSKDYHEGLTPV